MESHKDRCPQYLITSPPGILAHFTGVDSRRSSFLEALKRSDEQCELWSQGQSDLNPSSDFLHAGKVPSSLSACFPLFLQMNIVRALIVEGDITYPPDNTGGALSEVIHRYILQMGKLRPHHSTRDSLYQVTQMPREEQRLESGSSYQKVKILGKQKSPLRAMSWTASHQKPSLPLRLLCRHPPLPS